MVLELSEPLFSYSIPYSFRSPQFHPSPSKQSFENGGSRRSTEDHFSRRLARVPTNEAGGKGPLETIHVTYVMNETDRGHRKEDAPDGW